MDSGLSPVSRSDILSSVVLCQRSTLACPLRHFTFRYRGNTIPLTSIGKIAHKEMIKSLHVSLELLRLGAVTWNGFLFLKLSHLCVLPLVLVSDERELLEALVFGVSTPRVSVLREGWKNLSTLQVSKTFTLPAFKGLSWLSTATGEPVIGKFFSLSKSGASTSDGCIIATRSLTISPNCVKAIHRWEPGRVLGLSFLFGQRCSQLDLCVLNTYSPTNSRGATSEAREAHELSRAAHWQKCERVFRRIPRRCELVWAMDGNARLGPPCRGWELVEIVRNTQKSGTATEATCLTL